MTLSRLHMLHDRDQSFADLMDEQYTEILSYADFYLLMDD